MNTNTDSGLSDPDAEELAAQRQDLGHIRSELTHYRPDIPHDGLRQATSEWLVAAREESAESAREAVSSMFADIRDGNPMYRQPSMTNGEDAFPEACSDCEHYGNVCPALARTVHLDRRKRIFEEYDDPARLRQELREYANDIGCIRLKDKLAEVTEERQPLLRRGQILLMLVEEEILYASESERVLRAVARELSLSVDINPAQFDYERLNGHPDDPLVGPAATEEPDGGEQGDTGGEV
jgi:hypothetical protein